MTVKVPGHNSVLQMPTRKRKTSMKRTGRTGSKHLLHYGISYICRYTYPKVLRSTKAVKKGNSTERKFSRKMDSIVTCPALARGKLQNRAPTPQAPLHDNSPAPERVKYRDNTSCKLKSG
jgi:hypothetical protein